MRWIQKVLFATLLSFALCLSFLLFIPINKVCYQLANYASSRALEVCYHSQSNHIASCQLHTSTIYYAKTPILKAEELFLSVWQLKAKKVTLLGLLSKFFPPTINTIRYNPLSGRFSAKGAFGQLQGSISLLKHTISIKLKPSHTMQTKYQSTLQLMRRFKGDYIYESSF